MKKKTYETYKIIFNLKTDTEHTSFLYKILQKVNICSIIGFWTKKNYQQNFEYILFYVQDLASKNIVQDFNIKMLEFRILSF